MAERNAANAKGRKKYTEYIEHFSQGAEENSEKVITIKDVSERFGISYDQARKVIIKNAKEAPEKRLVVKVGKRYMIRPSDFEKLIRDF